MGHEVFEGELILKEVFGTSNLPNYMALQKCDNFSVVINCS
jgi:hypothetical protein